MHDHFIIKALEGVRVGGVAAFITSTGTMDKTSKAARAEMAELADLVCAVRMPNGAHAAAAGTDVATDLLVFRRKAPSHKRQGAVFAKTEKLPSEDNKVMDVNEYFLARPHNVHGTLVPGRKRGEKYRPEVKAGRGDTAARLQDALDREVAAAVAGGLVMTANPERCHEEPAGPDARTRFGQDAERFDGRIIPLDDGTFWAARLEDSEPHPCPKTQRKELRALLDIRDAVSDLLDAETSPNADEAYLAYLRGVLNMHYDSYVATYGPITRFTRQERTRKPVWDDVPESLAEQLQDAALDVEGRLGARQQDAIDNLGDGTLVDDDLKVLLDWSPAKALASLREPLAALHTLHAELKETGKLVAWARVPPPQGGFADDPHAPLVYALEEFDEETNTATKAEIFTQRVTAPRQAPERADTPVEAAAISLDLYGEVRLDAVARLLGLPDEQAARTALGTVVFTEPHTGRLVPAAEYLSGNVRIKLAQARDAAGIDAAFAVNVQALTEVQPKDVPPEEIRVKLGAPWVAAPYVQEFLRELLRDESIKVERAAGSTWTVTCSTERNVMTTKVWGTEEMPAVQIIRALLNQKPIRIAPDFPEEATAAEKARLRAEAMTATTIANKYADRINDEFRKWLWRDDERTETLTDLCIHRPGHGARSCAWPGPSPALVGRHARGHAGGVESAPIVVHGRSLSGGRRVTVHRHGGEQVLGTAYSDHDLVVFLESTGIADPESVLDDPRWVQWRDDPAHDFAAA